MILASVTAWHILGPVGLTQQQPISLDCRLERGPWRSCRMEVVDPGRHWFLILGRKRYEFHHDGTGRMRMGLDGRWRDVTPQWGEDRSLCWNGLCARGDMPLD